MSRPMDFAEFCFIVNRLDPLNKRAEEGGFSKVLDSVLASPTATGALIGGGAGLVTGAFSDKPGSMLRHGLVGAGLGAGVGYGGSKLLKWLAQQQGSQSIAHDPLAADPGKATLDSLGLTEANPADAGYAPADSWEQQLPGSPVSHKAPAVGGWDEGDVAAEPDRFMEGWDATPNTDR